MPLRIIQYSFLCLVLVFPCIPTFAKDNQPSSRFDLSFDGITLIDAIQQLEDVSGYQITLNGSFDNERHYTIHSKNTLDNLIRQLLKNHNYYILSGDKQRNITIIGDRNVFTENISEYTDKKMKIAGNGKKDSQNIIQIDSNSKTHLKPGKYEVSHTSEGYKEFIPVEAANLSDRYKNREVEYSQTSEGYQEIIPVESKNINSHITKGNVEYSHTQEGYEEIIPISTPAATKDTKNNKFENSYTTEGYEELLPIESSVSKN